MSADEGKFAAWLQVAEKVAEELRRTGAARDLAGAAPVEEVDLLRRSGLLTIFLPEALAGGGAKVHHVVKIVRTLAKGDTSIAQIALHHLFGTALGANGPNRALFLRRARGFVEQGWFHGGVAQAAYEPLMSAAPAPGGFSLNGAKPFTTGAAVANTLHVWVRFAPDVEIGGRKVGGHIGQFVVANPTPGLSFGDDWDNMGQRLTVSGSATFENVFVSEEDLVAHWREDEPLPPHVTLFVPIIQLAFGELYLGTAQGALEEAKDYIHKRARPWLTSSARSASEDTLVIERFGRLAVALASAEALADAAGQAIQRAVDRGAELTARERGEAAVKSYQSKIQSTEVALEITSRIFELTGARSTTRALGLDRYWRNVRTHSLHDPVHYKIMEVGGYALNDIPPTPTYYS